ncbi:MAG: Hsp70 family protein [Ruminococcus sp.]|nr:Hsp70 family protein [Ruminococcus sp.]
MEILAVSGDNHLGGKDFNEAVAAHFGKTNGIDPKSLFPDEKAIIYRLAEQCKIALTSQPLAAMAANIGGRKYSMALDNNKLIEISAGIFERMAVPVKKALRDSRLGIDDIDEIILVGGSCKMPTVKAFIERITGKSPCTDIDPDTAIAVGAGIFAGKKDRNDKLKDIILTDICPFSLGISTLDGSTGVNVMSFIIERNSTLPTSMEVNRLLIARAERVFEESPGEEREIISAYLSAFTAALNGGKNREIKTEYERLCGLLDSIEGIGF